MSNLSLTALLIFVITPVLSILDGMVFNTLWKWFITPISGLSITVWQAIGLSIIVGYLTYQYMEDNCDDPMIDRLIRIVVLSLIRVIMALSWGYIVHLFV